MPRRFVALVLFTLACGGAASAQHRRHHTHERPSHTRRPPHDRPRERTTVVAPPREGDTRPSPGTPSPGCSRAGAAPRGVHEQTLTVGALERTYLLSVPERDDPDATPLPLVFAYHGLTGTPASLRGYLHVEREAAGAAIVVYPAGLRVSGRRGRSTTRWDTRADGADVAFFDALLTHLGETYCVDLGRVFAVGHSAGAVMTNEMGCHRGNVLRAIAPIAGMPPSSRRCTEAPSVWVTHGTADPDVAFHDGEATRDRWVTAAHCDAIPLATREPACLRYTGCDGGARVVFCAHDGDHGPPPFAAREVWRFFMGSGVE